jgi:ABC-2 type transport system permease protein
MGLFLKPQNKSYLNIPYYSSITFSQMLLKMLLRLFRLAKVFLSTYYANSLEYRVEIVFWVLSGSFPLIMMGIWSEASQTANFNLDSLDIFRYFLSVFIIRQLTVVWVIWTFEKEVVTGSLSPKLLQPVDPVWHPLSEHLSERLARLPFLIGLLLLFFAIYPEVFWIPSLSQFLLTAIAVILVFSLRFLIQYTFALFSFWLERVVAIEQFWYLIYIFLSGMIAPLDVFPETLRQIVLWTPFPYLLYFPTALLIGLPVDIGRGFMVTIAWLLAFLIFNRWLWKQGVKRYSGMGA